MFSQIFTWAATILALTGNILNCKQIKWCFVLWMVTNAMWFAWDIYIHLYNRAIMDAVQFALAVWGLYEWSKDGKKGTESSNR